MDPYSAQCATTSPVIVVIPCFNEAARMDEAEVRVLLEPDDTTVLFVDDGSTDATATVLDEICQRMPKGRAKLTVLPRNGGKAEAVRQGLSQALFELGGEIVGYLDADFSTPASEMHHLRAELERTGADVALGSRVARLGSRIERTPSRHYLGRVYATVASVVLDLAVYDTQCGAKLFRDTPALREAVSSPFRSRWSFDVELLGRLMSRGLGPDRMIEVPLRTWVDVPGSKLKLGGAVKAGLDLLALGARVKREGPEGFFP